MRRFHLAIVMLAVGATLSACASDPGPATPSKPTFHYSPMAPYVISATALQIEPVYFGGGGGQHVEQNYDYTPTDLAAAWARDRLSLAGASGKLTMRILEASVIETPLDVKQGLRGRFTNDQNRQLTARLSVELLLQEVPGGAPARASATASASRTFSEKEIGSAARPGYMLLLEELARNFDAALSPQVKAYLAVR